MAILMGPVLSFRGCDNNVWNISGIIVTDGDAPAVQGPAGAINLESLWEIGKKKALRFLMSFPMAAAASVSSYTVDGERYDIAIPATGQAPTMAYVSCNGFSSAGLMNTPDPFCMWRAMGRKHGLAPLKDAPKVDPTFSGMKETKPFHLLLMGGDQVYADEMFDSVKEMKAWHELSWDKANKAPLTNTLRDKLDAFYFDLYVRRWSQNDMAGIFARVPTVSMWDDHDFVDGWGSYPAERQNCPVFQGIWNSASKAFVTFQQQLAPGERRPGSIGVAPADWYSKPVPGGAQDKREGAFSFGYIVGKIGILAIDMRSQRTVDSQVVGEKHWDEVYDWIDANVANLDHLLVMSSIPVVYPDFAMLENALGIFPGHQDLEDDLRDHWNSPPHKWERSRLVHRLLEKAAPKARTTILSGDVHVAALGIIQSTRKSASDVETVINQLISSGVVHPGPGAIVLFALQNLFSADDPIDRDIVGRMMPFSENKAKFVGTRNFLSIEPDAPEATPGMKPRLWCNFIVEKETYPLVKVIHPISTTVRQ